MHYLESRRVVPEVNSGGSIGGGRLLLVGEVRVVVAGHPDIALHALLAKVERDATSAGVLLQDAGGAILVKVVAARLALAQIEVVAVREQLPRVVGVTATSALAEDACGCTIREEILQDGVDALLIGLLGLHDFLNGG